MADGDTSASNGQREADPVELNSGELLLVVGRTEMGRGRRRSCLNGVRETERLEREKVGKEDEGHGQGQTGGTGAWLHGSAREGGDLDTLCCGWVATENEGGTRGWWLAVGDPDGDSWSGGSDEWRMEQLA